MNSLDPRYKILALYVVFSFAVLMGCLPNMSAQNAGAIAAFILLISAYIFESKHASDSLETHHAIFIIRTIWIWSIFLLIGMCGAGYVVSQQGDMSAIDLLMNNVTNGIVPTEDDINVTLDSYFNTNSSLILKTALIWLAPAQIYAVWRIALGATRAYKGYRILNFRGWF